MNQNKPEWEKEFDKLFVASNPCSSGWYHTVKPVSSYKIKEFISDLIEKTREETIKEIRSIPLVFKYGEVDRAVLEKLNSPSQIKQNRQ